MYIVVPSLPKAVVSMSSIVHELPCRALPVSFHCVASFVPLSNVSPVPSFTFLTPFTSSVRSAFFV